MQRPSLSRQAHSHGTNDADAAMSASPAAPKRRRRSRGQALVEFAVILPVFMLMLLGMIDFGAGLFTYMSVINGARVGAHTAILAPASTSQIANAAQSAGVGTSTVTTTCWSVSGNGGTQVPTTAPGGAGWGSCATAKTGDTVAVTEKYTYSMLFPLPFGNTISMASTMEMIID